MKKSAFIAILFFCAAARSQSPLSLQYPFGLPEMSVTGASAALAGSGTAVAEEYFGPCLNPANIAVGKRSVFSALVSFDRTSISDNGGSSAVSKYSPKTVSLILPLGAVGNVGFAMQKRYEAGISFSTETDNTEGNRTVTNSIDLHNTGGLTAWQAGWAYRLKNGLSFGLMYERFFFNKSSSNTFESVFKYDLAAGDDDDPVTFKASAQQTETTAFSSDGIRFGIQVPVHEKVTAAAAAEYVFLSDNGRTSSEYRRPGENAVKTPEKDFEVRMPPSINIGLSYKPSERWLIASDAQATLWERYHNELPRAYSWSAGGRFTPAVNRLSAKYWEKILYSAGVRYSQLPLEGSHEYSFSAGAGLPIPNGGGVIDLVFDFGRRTDERYSDYSENVIKFQLGINGGRNWFQNKTPK